MRMHPEMRVGQELQVHAIADLRASMGGPDAKGVAVGAWGVAETPVGTISAGRMPIPRWGLGLIANPGGCLNCLSDMTVDRVSFDTELGGHIVGLAGDASADGIGTATLTLGRIPTDLQRSRATDSGHDIWGYGMWSTWRTRSRDGLGVGLADGWMRYEVGQLRVEAEGVFAGGQIRSPESPDPSVVLPPVYVQQGGGALQLEWDFIGVEAGFASGDLAPGRGVADGMDQIDLPRDQAWTNLVIAENYSMDRLQFRRRIGALTDVAWFRPSITVQPDERLLIRGWFTASTTLVQADALHPEVGGTVQWNAWQGLQLRGDVAYLVGDGAIVEGYVAWVY